MNIKENTKVMIFRYDGQYGASYSIGLSKKDQNGNYQNGYIPCKFKKDVEVANKTQIIIKNAWITFNSKDNKTYPYVFINEFERVGETQEEKTDAQIIKEVVSDPFNEFANEVEISESDLPF